MEYDKLKNEFLANISHELRTPINVLFSAIQLLDVKDQHERNLPYTYIKYKNVIKQNCNRLLRLINNLIDITKIDAGFYEINLVNNDIIKIVEDITLSVASYAEIKNLKLIFDTDMEEKIIACDKEKIERIMMNLLSNAAKFTESEGKINVNIKEKNNNVVICVKNNGCGIPKDKLVEIFERFKQVDKSLKRTHEGSGIGLSLVKSLVELHGGQVYAESILGEGSEFIVELPIKVIEDKIACTVEYLNYDGNHDETINIEFSDIYEINESSLP